MPTAIDLAQTERLVSGGAQLVEVLPANEYGEAHIPERSTCRSRSSTARTATVLDRSRPVIVYCWDSI